MRQADLTEEFSRHRRFLQGVAYRLLGSVDEAQDVVQESFVRARRAERETIREPRAWLTRIVARLCLDRLRSARVRRETYVGPWLPEPVVNDVEDGDPANIVALDEQVSLAFMTILEALSPAERVVYVLHEAFEIPLTEIAEIVGRTPGACRQLAVRARRHIAERRPRFDPDPRERERIVAGFKSACETGDVEALARLLDEEVVLRADGGGAVVAPKRPVKGRSRVLRFLLARLGSVSELRLKLILVNGQPGLAALVDPAPAIIAPVVHSGRIVQIDIVANPQKLDHLDLAE